jgi:hypothetical protein
MTGKERRRRLSCREEGLKTFQGRAYKSKIPPRFNDDGSPISSGPTNTIVYWPVETVIGGSLNNPPSYS